MSGRRRRPDPVEDVTETYAADIPEDREDEYDTAVIPQLTDEFIEEFESERDRLPLDSATPTPEPDETDTMVEQNAVPTRLGQKRARARRARRARSRRARMLMLALSAALFCIGAVSFATMKLQHWQPPGKDFTGPAQAAVVIQVHSGDTAEEIAEVMASKGVVASSSAFYKAALSNAAMGSVQSGYYAVPSHIPAAQAVSALVDKGSRVGNVVLSDGRQLFNSRDAATGAVKEGIYHKISAASCYGPVGQQKCVSVEQLEAAGANEDLAALGVPDWALDPVRKVPDRRRQLEGLIAAGTFDFDPQADATAILHQLVSTSATRYQETGIVQAGAVTQLTPYQQLIAASLVEREALPQDMTRVARVIENRLKINQPLEFDSTVNYSLAETAVATTDADRARKTPWNTYAKYGLPATPISSPSIGALKAVEAPAPGPWIYFVTINKQGVTLFTASYPEHLKNIERAKESGILDTVKSGSSGSGSR